jgi:CDP-L-myo-inositol myo-inositolphosphotransferase
LKARELSESLWFIKQTFDLDEHTFSCWRLAVGWRGQSLKADNKREHQTATTRQIKTMNPVQLLTENTALEKTLNGQASVKNAVILAAGKSQRFRENGTKKPKVLLRVGGLRLLERSILTLKEAGVERFRVVVGAYRDQVVAEMKSIPRLQELDIEYVVCEDFALGNGITFAAGAAGFDEPFLLAMSDHIFSPETVTDFIEKASAKPHLPALACDGNLGGVFDMDDATKVASRDGFIHHIGKEIPTYDLVDTGLFYFPAGYGRKVADKAKAGGHSVSGIIQHFIDEKGVRAVPLDNAMWQDVDNPGMKKEAERRLIKTLFRPEDGWVSRHINRFFSTWISCRLARLGIHPNAVTTAVFLLTLLGAWFAATGVYQMIVLGALIFQLASVLDGCDGELARLTFRTSRLGSWYGRLAGSLRYVIFFEALGISAYKATGSQVYLFAVTVLAALAIYMLVQMAMFAWKQGGSTHQIQPQAQPSRSHSGLLENFFTFWREINKQDVTAFLTFLLCIVFLYQAMFWLALLGTVATSIMVSRSVNAASVAKNGANIFEKIDPIIFYLLGVIILCVLIFNMEISVVADSLTAVGNKVFLVFSVAVLWILSNTFCIRTLVQGKVPFADLLFNQMTGDAYNTIIPMGGLGGEPYKIKHLTQWLDWHTASRAIVVDRLIHATTGMLFSAVAVGFTLLTVEIDSKFMVPLAIVSCVFAAGGLGMIWLALSSAPSKIAGYILKKLKIVEEFRNDPLPAGRFFQAFFFKFLGRSFNLIELLVIFSILGFAPGFGDLVAVAGMVSTSATLFFIIPQGLGVNEAGISSALSFLGYTAALGLTFGLIRRARMIFWALFGVALHLAVSVVKKLALSRARS